MLTTEEFYDQLSQFYDVMNDWSARLAYEGPFLRQLLEGHSALSVLDAACGTGQHALVLKQWGFLPTGVDASPRMIHRAQTEASASGLAVRFLVSRFQELPSLFGPVFDAVLCLGNSLPHVESSEDLDASLSGMVQVLRPGGLLLLHNLNYDKRLAEKPRFFKLDSGLLDDREVLVWRMADYEESTIIFHTALFQREDGGKWTVQVHSTAQRPLLRGDLVDRLHGLGLVNVRAYGNLKGEPFVVSSSGDLVLAATKPA